jgi:hypothetical protein
MIMYVYIGVLQTKDFYIKGRCAHKSTAMLGTPSSSLLANAGSLWPLTVHPAQGEDEGNGYIEEQG